MSTKLLAMLISLGAVVVGGQSYTLNIIAPGSSKAELVDAGLLPCAARDIEVDVRLADELALSLPDAGVAARRHRRVLLDACLRADNNVILTDKRLYVNRRPDPRIIILPSTARPGAGSTANEDGSLVLKTPLCACRRAAGTCQARRKGGALATAPLGSVLGAGQEWTGFSGAGCEPMACVQLYGENAWPEACPTGP